MRATANNLSEKTDTPIIESDKPKIDGDGYLIDRYEWNKILASQLAGAEGITLLTESHWQVILYIRDYFNRLNAMPPPRRVCRQLGIEGHNIKVMFGSCLTVWRIAGLPNPGDEVKAHIH